VHDLRNPLTEIYSCAELLSQMIPESLMSPDMLQIVQAFKRNSENLVSMVSNIMDYAKIKAKKLELDL
jgi:signal transduction histidine kinase